jgi:hypothetical protein
VDEQIHPPTSPEEARRLAETAVDWAPLYCGFDLVFSPASLHQLDSLLDGFHITGGLQAQGDLLAANDEETATVLAWANLAGCYLGEVLIRNYGGAWRRTEETEWRKIQRMSQFPLVLELPGGIICSPLSKPFKVLECGRPPESLFDFYQAVTSADTEQNRTRRGT